MNRIRVKRKSMRARFEFWSIRGGVLIFLSNETQERTHECWPSKSLWLGNVLSVAARDLGEENCFCSLTGLNIAWSLCSNLLVPNHSHITAHMPDNLVMVAVFRRFPNGCLSQCEVGYKKEPRVTGNHASARRQYGAFTSSPYP